MPVIYSIGYKNIHFTSGVPVQTYKCHFNRTFPHHVSRVPLFCHLFVYCDCLIQTNAAFLCASNRDKNWREIATKQLQNTYSLFDHQGYHFMTQLSIIFQKGDFFSTKLLVILKPELHCIIIYF